MSEKNKQRKWVREEVIILVAEYFRTKNLSNKEIINSHETISKVLRNREKFLTGKDVSQTFRDYSGIRMQSGRIRCIDPGTKYTGMQGTKLQIEVVDEFLKNPNKLNQEAEEIMEKYMNI